MGLSTIHQTFLKTQRNTGRGGGQINRVLSSLVEDNIYEVKEQTITSDNRESSEIYTAIRGFLLRIPVIDLGPTLVKYDLDYTYILIFWPCRMACGILVPTSVKALSSNYWTGEMNVS